MSTMDHAEAHERIADLALEPRRLSALPGSDDPEDATLLRHVAECPRCQREVAEWRGFQSTLGDLIGADRPEQLEPIVPPPDVRRRVLAAARRPTSIGVARASLQSRINIRRAVAGRRLMALAAVLAIVAVGLGVLIVRDQAQRSDQAALERAWLTEAVGGMSRILASPEHRQVVLLTPSGASGGSIAWSRHDLVVLASNLPAPAPGQIYRCWLASQDRETPVGVMWFVEGNAFWAGSTVQWAAIDIGPERRFLVTLEPAAQSPASQHTGPVVLEAVLSS